MNEERTRKCLQVEHIRGHLWHIYSITVNQVMVATVKLSQCWLQLKSSIVRHSMRYWSYDFKQQSINKSHILLSGFKGSWFTHILNHPHTHPCIKNNIREWRSTSHKAQFIIYKQQSCIAFLFTTGYEPSCEWCSSIYIAVDVAINRWVSWVCPDIDLVSRISVYNYISGHGHLITAIMVINKNDSFCNVIFYNFERTNCWTSMAPHSDIICESIYTSHRDGEHTRKLAVGRIHICYYGVINQCVMVINSNLVMTKICIECCWLNHRSNSCRSYQKTSYYKYKSWMN